MILNSIDRHILAIIALVYFFSAKGYIEVLDTRYSLMTAEAIISRGRMDIPPVDGASLKGLDGRIYSKYGIGLPLYYTPFVLAGSILSRMTHFPADEITGFLISFANIPFALFTVILFIQLLRLFGAPNPYLWLLAVGLGLGTLGWRYASSDFSEMMQTALLLLAVYGVICMTTASVLAGGLGLAGLILVKLVHLSLFPIFLVYLLFRPGKPGPQRIREAALFAGPVILCIILIAGLNLIRFGNPLESGYGAEMRLFFPTQLWHTLPRLLFSLDKGLFIFSPILLLGLFGWRAFFRQRPWDAGLCGALCLVNLVLAGAWHSWMGGWSWGPRLLVPAIPLWFLPAAFWLSRPGSRGRVVGTVLLLMGSVLVQFPGILVKDQEIHHIRYNMCTPEEQSHMPPDYVAALIMLSHKIIHRNELYHISEFGIPGNRELDLSEYRTFQGFNLWTDHIARRFLAPEVRWLPVLGLLLASALVISVPRMIKETILS